MDDEGFMGAWLVCSLFWVVAFPPSQMWLFESHSPSLLGGFQLRSKCGKQMMRHQVLIGALNLKRRANSICFGRDAHRLSVCVPVLQAFRGRLLASRCEQAHSCGLHGCQDLGKKGGSSEKGSDITQNKQEAESEEGHTQATQPDEFLWRWQKVIDATSM